MKITFYGVGRYLCKEGWFIRQCVNIPNGRSGDAIVENYIDKSGSACGFYKQGFKSRREAISVLKSAIPNLVRFPQQDYKGAEETSFIQKSYEILLRRR